MTAHRPHPIAGPWPHDGADLDSPLFFDPDDAVLFDGCDRCAQHAARPLSGSIDATATGRLWQRMLEVELERHPAATYRTQAEARACEQLYALAVWIGLHQPAVNPWVWPWTVGPATI